MLRRPSGAARGVEQLIHARRQAIQGVATQHDLDGIRWWPPTASPSWLDFLVEGVPGSLPAFRADLERALGCRVAIYLADQLPADVWQRIAPQTVQL
jgi:hypothetical protein